MHQDPAESEELDPDDPGCGNRSAGAGGGAAGNGTRAPQRRHPDLSQRDWRKSAVDAGAGTALWRAASSLATFVARQKMIEHNSAARSQHRQALPQPRHPAAGPGRGGQSRPDTRAGEIRPRARLPLFNLCDLVDTPEHRARDHESVAHDPAAGTCSQGAEPGIADLAQASSPAAAATATLRRSRNCSTSRWTKCARFSRSTSIRLRSMRRWRSIPVCR